MEYFHMGIFVIPGVFLIKKYGSQTTAFFSIFQNISRGNVSDICGTYLADPGRSSIVFPLDILKDRWSLS